MNTIVNVNKPQGISSFGAVKIIKKLFNIKKVGHLGTLDPMATGVLPIFVGKATKLIPLFNELDKEYRATLKLGERTDSFDKEGTIIENKDWSHLSIEEVKNCVLSFQGEQKQLTPAYSAVKYQGVPSYHLARQGIKVTPKERFINIKAIDIESVQLPLVEIRIKCSKGTYIRSLADDIGQALEVGAHLESLERLAVGSYFSMKNAYALKTLAWYQEQGDNSYRINPVDILDPLVTIQVSLEEKKRISHGQSVVLNDHNQNKNTDQQMLAKAIDPMKNLVAIGHLISGKNCLKFNPKKILI